MKVEFKNAVFIIFFPKYLQSVYNTFDIKIECHLTHWPLGDVAVILN